MELKKGSNSFDTNDFFSQLYTNTGLCPKRGHNWDINNTQRRECQLRMIPLTAAEPCFKCRKSPLLSAFGHQFLRALLSPSPCALSLFSAQEISFSIPKSLANHHSFSIYIAQFHLNLHLSRKWAGTVLPPLTLSSRPSHLGGGMTCELNLILII